MKRTVKFEKFWFYYFCIRIFFLFFAVFVYGKITTLGDTERYLTSGISFSPDIFYSSTKAMFFVGGLIGKAFGGHNILSNLPFAILSFFVINWAIEKLEYKNKVNKLFLFFLLSLPNFCIWTSICSKETFGLVFSAILGVLIVSFLRGDFKIRFRDLVGFYLCFLFKPQYLPFILQGLLLIYLLKKTKTPITHIFITFLFLVVNITILYILKDDIDQLSQLMYAHFDSGESTRENPFVNTYDFFHIAPMGMFTAFFGPTFTEMISSPANFIAGLESTILLLLFLYLTGGIIVRLILKWKIDVAYSMGILFIVLGLCFIHYPFGIFNPGSAIRYRTNFLFIFILIFLELYTHTYYYYKTKLMFVRKRVL